MQPPKRHRLAACVALGVALQFSAAHPAAAQITLPTPTLPLLDIPYISATGAGCFPARNLCVSSGSLTLTSVLSSTFNPSGQDLIASAIFTGQLSTISNAPLGPITLTGTLEQEVLGRTTSTETGSWTSDITALSLSGPLSGNTLTFSLDASNPSSGTTTLTPDGGQFLANSFFDVYVALSLDGAPPLHATRGPLQFQAAAITVPEPATILMLAPALLGILVARRRR